MYKNLFLTKKPTDQVWHLILAKVEKGEVILDDTTPKSYLPKTPIGDQSVKVGKNSRKVSSLAS